MTEQSHSKGQSCIERLADTNEKSKKNPKSEKNEKSAIKGISKFKMINREQGHLLNW